MFPFFAETEVACLSHYHVVQELDVEDLAAALQLLSHPDVRRAGMWIVGGMVVNEHEGGGVAAQCHADDASLVDHRGVHVAAADHPPVENLVPGGQEEHPQLLVVEVSCHVRHRIVHVAAACNGFSGVG